MPVKMCFPSSLGEVFWSFLNGNSNLPVSFTIGDDTTLESHSSLGGEVILNDEQEILKINNGTKEILISNFVLLNTEQERLTITNPLSKLYLVKETGKLWFWDPTNLWWMLLNTGEAKTKNINAYTLNPASSVHTTFGSSGALRLQLSVLNSAEEIYLSLGNSSMSIIVSQTVTSDSSYFVIYRYNELTDRFYCVAYTDLIENLFATVGRKQVFFSHINEEIINTSDLYYLGVLSNANGGGLLGNNSTVVNNAPFMNCYIDNITDVDFSTTLAYLNGEGDLQVNPDGHAAFLSLSSYKNE